MGGGVVRKPHGLFIGLSTLDIIQLVERVPASDEKVVSRDVCVAAGGPAANAAVVFSALGGEATLVTRLGADVVGEVVERDLSSWGVRVVNAAEGGEVRTGTSSILITEGTGERAVVSPADFGRSTHENSRDETWGEVCVEVLGVEFGNNISEYDVVVVDSYEIELSLPVIKAAYKGGVPVVFDCGVKKERTDEQLRYVSIAAVAEYYAPFPADDIVGSLTSQGVPFAVVTAGAQPLTYKHHTSEGVGTIPVGQVRAVDTLGAGDFFHGALAHIVAVEGLNGEMFEKQLKFASEVAGLSVQSFGSRRWLDDTRNAFYTFKEGT